MKRIHAFYLTAAALWLASPAGAYACAACFGKSDSNMAKSLNAAIFSMMAVVAVVLGGAATFFVFLSRRTAARNAADATPISKN